MTVSDKLNKTLYTLEGIQHTLKIYSTQSNHEEIQSVLNDAASSINEIVNDLEKRIKIIEFEEPQYHGH